MVSAHIILKFFFHRETVKICGANREVAVLDGHTYFGVDGEGGIELIAVFVLHIFRVDGLAFLVGIFVFLVIAVIQFRTQSRSEMNPNGIGNLQGSSETKLGFGIVAYLACIT